MEEVCKGNVILYQIPPGRNSVAGMVRLALSECRDILFGEVSNLLRMLLGRMGSKWLKCTFTQRLLDNVVELTGLH